MAEIVPVTSEALEAQVRNLLPSQRGFGEDLQASNVITPIIDLTAAAQGTDVPLSMQQAIAFGSQTAFAVSNSTSVIANTPGFYRIFGVSDIQTAGAATPTNSFTMTDGLSVKTVWTHKAASGAGGLYVSVQFDFICFLAAGESISATTNYAASFMNGSTRQVADSVGNLVNPSGFNPQ